MSSDENRYQKPPGGRCGSGGRRAAAAGTRLAARPLTSFRDDSPRNRWLMVTINCPPDRVPPDELPAPVARLRDKAEVTIRPAPGDRGTELGLRLHEPPPSGLAGLAVRLSGDDPRQDVRAALRDAKSLIETGEVIKPTEPPTSRQTLLGKPIELAIRRSGGEGRL
jgi:hypothetical protein